MKYDTCAYICSTSEMWDHHCPYVHARHAPYVHARRQRRCSRKQQQQGNAYDDGALHRDGVDGRDGEVLVTRSNPVAGTAVTTEEQSMPRMALMGTPTERPLDGAQVVGEAVAGDAAL